MGLLIERHSRLGVLAVDIDIELVARVDGGIIGGEDGLGAVALGIADVGQLLAGVAGGQHE